jgi:DNA polymerase-3 subunit epsilon
MRQTGGLTERALRALAGGPLPTTTVARAVLGIQGGAGAAAAAVFALLGADSRFAVDAAGVWSLTEQPVERPAPTLRDEDWVVVDVETTGGSPHAGHRVTEVAAVWVRGVEVVRTWSTLVNPERRIPGMITSLTGISDAMVRDAPRFRDIAPELTEVHRGRVFVAHNAAFDWRFVQAEMERAMGSQMAGRQLCTVRLARKLLPQLPSRSLDGLAEYFGLDIEARHRALDDAVATAKVLGRFCEMLEEREVVDWAGVQALLRQRAPRRKRRATPKSMDSA